MKIMGGNKYYLKYLEGDYNLKKLTSDKKEDNEDKDRIKKLLCREFEEKRHICYGNYK